MKKINRVAVIGGTHGNELTGIYLVNKFERSPNLITRSNFKTVVMLANPKACKIGKRYIDIDLNRCFLRQDLENNLLSTYEALRAKEIYQMFGSNNRDNADVIIDLHNTTANMGITFILDSQHPFNLELTAHLTSIDPNIKVLVSGKHNQDSSVLRSISPLGFTLEVGPVAQGILDGSLFQQTEEIIGKILDYVEGYNFGKIPPAENPLTIYQKIETIDYPRNELGEILGMIHPRLQFRDYQPLNPGDPMFLTFDGDEILYEGTATVYPVFINEAAYYEKGIAMYFTQKQMVGC